MFYDGIKMFNILPLSVTVLENEKVKFEATSREHTKTFSFYIVDEFFMCKYDCNVIF